MTAELKCLDCEEPIAPPIEPKQDRNLGYFYIICPHCRTRNEVTGEGDDLRVLRVMVPDEPYM